MRNGLNTLISIEIYRLVKLILTTSVFLSTSLWADMDDICFVFIDSSANTDSYWGIADYIGKNCDRDNILQMTGDADGKRGFNISEANEEPYYMATPYPDLIATWCRFDRNVNDNVEMEWDESLKKFYKYRYVSCVLYSNKPREVIE